MAFIFYKSVNDEKYPIAVSLPTTASETYTLGEALVLSSGTLTKCGATTKPTHIAAKAYVAPSSGNEDLPVYPVLPHYEYLTTFSADATSNVIGTLVTIDSTGLLVTATDTSGVATIVNKLGLTGNQTNVVVRFI